MKRQIAICSMMHFLVDGLCICCLYLLVAPDAIGGWVGLFMGYNVLAFVTQPLTGWMADRARHPHWMLLTAMALLTLAVMTAVGMGLARQTPTWGMWTVAALLGLGNSFFHVWGGKQTAVVTDNDVSALGMFVSTGAFGLAVGGVFCSWTLLGVFLAAICLLAIAYLQLETATQDDGKRPVDVFSTVNPEDHFPLPRHMVWIGIGAVMAFVAGRSLISGLFAADIGKSTSLILATGLVAMLGKMAGGWIAKGAGMLKTFFALVAAVSACLLFAEGNQTLAFMGLFLINCTMPITLWIANEMMNGKEGLAFGLLAAPLVVVFLFF